MKLTTKHMDSNPTERNQWFVESGQRGEGTFLGRITPQGNKLFYFRYTGPDRRQVRLTIGFYAKPGSSGGLTVAEARAVALEWATLYKSGIRDLTFIFFPEENVICSLIFIEKGGIVRTPCRVGT